MANWEVGSGKTYSTIQLACDALFTSVGTNTFTETQTILIYDGIYAETVSPNAGLHPTAAYHFQIGAAADNQPIITTGGIQCTLNNSPMDIFGIQFQCPVPVYTGYGGSGGAVNVYNNFFNCAASVNPIYVASLPTKIYNNLFIGSTTIDIDMHVGQCTVQGNTFYGASKCINITAANMSLVSNNNIFYKTGGYVYYSAGGASDPLSYFTSNNNIIYISSGNVAYIVYTPPPSYDPHTFATFANWQAAGRSPDSSSYGTDPKLVNPGTTTDTDYKILTDSPGKDKGATLSLYTTDYFGTSRPQGSNYDIGFHEFPVAVVYTQIYVDVGQTNYFGQTVSGVSGAYVK